MIARAPWRGSLGLAMCLAGCGAAAPPAETAPPPISIVEATPSDPAPVERACLSGTIEHGLCEVFSAALEPLPALSAHCRESGGHWLDACPSEGRVGTCSGEGRRAIYYGGGLGQDALRRACEAEGHTFSP